MKKKLKMARLKDGGSNSAHMPVKKLTFCSMAVVLSVITSYIKIINLPMGGSVTLMSMFFVCLIGNFYGAKIGIVTGTAFGILQFLIDPVILNLPQVILDYPLAFGALGLSGFFSKQKHGLVLGYIAGVLGRYVFATLSGIIFFASYAPNGMNPFVYSAVYNGLYLGIEAAITVILISLPPVSKAIDRIKIKAVS